MFHSDTRKWPVRECSEFSERGVAFICHHCSSGVKSHGLVHHNAAKLESLPTQSHSHTPKRQQKEPRSDAVYWNDFCMIKVFSIVQINPPKFQRVCLIRFWRFWLYLLCSLCMWWSFVKAKVWVSSCPGQCIPQWSRLSLVRGGDKLLYSLSHPVRRRRNHLLSC